MNSPLAAVRFDTAGLIPAICQEDGTGMVLVLAYMNSDALERTLSTGEVHFWSRSRQALWRKGETSGNTLQLVRMAINCEGDSLLLTVTLNGPGACHAGYRSCYYRTLLPDGTLQVVMPPTFDPGTVYAIDANAGRAGVSQFPSGTDPRPRHAELASLMRELYAGYGRLRDDSQRYLAVSGTARMLNDPEMTPIRLRARAREELGELAGVLDGSHRHEGGRADVLLESSQVGFWLCLAACAARYSYEEWHPDVVLWRAWKGEDQHRDAEPTAGAMANPAIVKGSSSEPDTLLAMLWNDLTELGILLARAGVHPTEPVARDLASLNARLASVEPGGPSTSDGADPSAET